MHVGGSPLGCPPGNQQRDGGFDGPLVPHFSLGRSYPHGWASKMYGGSRRSQRSFGLRKASGAAIDF